MNKKQKKEAFEDWYNSNNKDNIDLAKFMKYKMRNGVFYTEDFGESDDYFYYEANELCFDNDWNWLMKVIQKFNLILLDNDLSEFSDEFNEIWGYIQLSLCDCNIVDTYQYCVDLVNHLSSCEEENK